MGDSKSFQEIPRDSGRFMENQGDRELSGDFGEFGRFLEVLGGFERFWEILEGFRRFWEILEGFRRFWEI